MTAATTFLYLYLHGSPPNSNFTNTSVSSLLCFPFPSLPLSGSQTIPNISLILSITSMQSFVVLDDVRAYYNAHGSKGSTAEEEWCGLYTRYAEAYPQLAEEFTRRMKGELPADWKNCLPSYSHLDTKPIATRNRYVLRKRLRKSICNQICASSGVH